MRRARHAALFPSTSICHRHSRFSAVSAPRRIVVQGNFKEIVSPEDASPTRNDDAGCLDISRRLWVTYFAQVAMGEGCLLRGSIQQLSQKIKISLPPEGLANVRRGEATTRQIVAVSSIPRVESSIANRKSRERKKVAMPPEDNFPENYGSAHQAPRNSPGFDPDEILTDRRSLLTSLQSFLVITFSISVAAKCARGTIEWYHLPDLIVESRMTSIRIKSRVEE